MTNKQDTTQDKMCGCFTLLPQTEQLCHHRKYAECQTPPADGKRWCDVPTLELTAATHGSDHNLQGRCGIALSNVAMCKA